MKTKATYPDKCNQATKQFVDKVNLAMSTINLGDKSPIILNEYYLGQNGVYHTIFKVAFPNYIIINFECFDDEGTHFYNEKKHYEHVKIVKYSKDFKPIQSVLTKMFNIDVIKSELTKLV